MRNFLLSSFLGLLTAGQLFAQGPFQFREAYLLENRIAWERAGEEYDPNHSEEWQSRTVGCMVNCQPGQVSPREYLPNYNSRRWIDLLLETDKFRRMGGFELAEKQYIDMIAMLRKAQGPSTSDVALVLDHLGEFYLEERNFERAYTIFSEALEVRRKTIEALVHAQQTGDAQALAREASLALYAVTPGNDAALALLVCRLHLADLLTRLGQLDLAKGDLDLANQRLSEAVAISNENGYRRFVSGLYAIYFQSLVLEKQGKWHDAESLWQQAVKLRDTLQASAPYWNALKEMAAFYARQGDFHKAGDIARQVDTGVVGKQLRPEVRMPFSVDSRYRTAREEVYDLESNTAMSEIEAVDKWQTDGPDVAAAILKDPSDRNTIMLGSILDRGSDSERIKLLAWYEQRVFLHMSILLDGTPSQDRINRAYALLSNVKGRYLATVGETNQLVESWRGNPNIQSRQLAMIDQLNQARDRYARLFVGTALEGKPFNREQFAASENMERILAEALSSGNATETYSVHANFSLPVLGQQVPLQTALVDFVVWDRMDRNSRVPSHREYGAFVLSHGQPLKYVRIGAVDEIDGDISTLESGVISNHLRAAARIDEASHDVSSEEVRRRLGTLYQRVITPLEASLHGVTKLWIVPDGKLALVPFGGFVDGKGQYMLERFSINYLSSWRDLMSVATRSDKTSSPVVVANPDFNFVLPGPVQDSKSTPASPGPILFRQLPGAELEAADIEETLQIPPERILVGKAARKGLIQSLAAPEIFHFATHSVPYLHWTSPVSEPDLFEFPPSLVTQDPLLQSVIALAGANVPQSGPEDGFLTGVEVASLRLTGTKLVVLSTCESGQGVPVNGQGILGLRAAFSIAGAQSLVMSLWPVDDQAGRQFMKFFYSHLDAGPAEGVRLAQIDLMTKTEFKHPYYWAGFVASGSSQPVHVVSKKSEANPTAPKESFVAPTCFEISSHSGEPNFTQLRTIRIKIGGIVRRVQESAERMSYELPLPANELEESYSVKVNGFPVKGSAERKLASQVGWSVTLTVERRNDQSGISVLYGPAKDPRNLIELKGNASLFPSLDIPIVLPTLSAYAVAKGVDNGTIDRVAACSAEPLQ